MTTDTMTQSSDKREPLSPGFGQGPLALLCGLTLACGVFFGRPYVAGPDDTLTRYLNDPLEYVLLTMFFVGLSHVVIRFLAGRRRMRQLSAIEPSLRDPNADERTWREAANATSDDVITGHLLSLADLRRRWSGGSVVEYAKLFAARAADEVASGYAVLHTVLWAIPIVGFLGTVLGITKAIASITPEQLEGSLVEVTGNLAFAFDTTGLSLGFSLVLGFAMLVARRLEDRSLVRLDSLTEAWMLPHFPEGSPSADLGGDAVREVLESWSAEMVNYRQQLGETLERVVQATGESFESRAAELRDSTLSAQAEQWESSSHRVGQSVRQWSEEIDAVLSQSGQRFASGLRVCTGEANETLAIASEQQKSWETILDRTRQLEQLQSSIDSQLSRARFAEQLDDTLHQLTAAVHMLTSRAKAA